jgi:hypothetical protein
MKFNIIKSQINPEIKCYSLKTEDERLMLYKKESSNSVMVKLMDKFKEREYYEFFDIEELKEIFDKFMNMFTENKNGWHDYDCNDESSYPKDTDEEYLLKSKEGCYFISEYTPGYGWFYNDIVAYRRIE